MTVPFGPQLIGETEKTLNALLRRALSATGLSEPHWVTLRLAGRLDAAVGAEELAATVADRAHFADASALVGELGDRGLLDGGTVTPAGHRLVTEIQAAISELTAPIWRDLDADDVGATTRVLNEVVTRARAALAA